MSLTEQQPTVKLKSTSPTKRIGTKSLINSPDKTFLHTKNAAASTTCTQDECLYYKELVERKLTQYKELNVSSHQIIKELRLKCAQLENKLKKETNLTTTDTINTVSQESLKTSASTTEAYNLPQANLIPKLPPLVSTESKSTSIVQPVKKLSTVSKETQTSITAMTLDFCAITRVFDNLFSTIDSLNERIQDLLIPGLESIKNHTEAQKILINSLNLETAHYKSHSTEKIRHLEQQLQQAQLQLSETKELTRHSLQSPSDDQPNYIIEQQEKELSELRQRAERWTKKEKENSSMIDDLMKGSKERIDLLMNQCQKTEQENLDLKGENARAESVIQTLRAQIIQLRADLASVTGPNSKLQQSHEPRELEATIESLKNELVNYQSRYEAERAAHLELKNAQYVQAQIQESNHTWQREASKLEKEKRDLTLQLQLKDQQMETILTQRDSATAKENGVLKRKCELLQDQIARLMQKYNPTPCHGNEEVARPLSPVATSSRPTQESMSYDIPPVSYENSSQSWVCSHCTYNNSSDRQICEMCSAKRVFSTNHERSHHYDPIGGYEECD